MLLDSLDGMNNAYRLLVEFLSGPQTTLTLAAKIKGLPAPYDTFLSGLRVTKDNGPIYLRLADDGYLDLSGTQENLSYYVANFKFSDDEEGEHHHPEYAFRDGKPLNGYLSPGTLSLIIEVDSDYISQLENGG